MLEFIVSRWRNRKGTESNEEQASAPKTTNSEQSKPYVELDVTITQDLRGFIYGIGRSEDTLYDAGFRDGDFTLLRFRQNGATVDMPARILKTGVKGSGNDIEINSYSPNDLIQLNDVRSHRIVRYPDLDDVALGDLRIYPLTDDFTVPFSRANMEGGNEHPATLEVSLRYRLPSTKTLDPATLLERVTKNYPKSMGEYFDGIPMRMPLPQN